MVYDEDFLINATSFGPVMTSDGGVATPLTNLLAEKEYRGVADYCASVA